MLVPRATLDWSWSDIWVGLAFAAAVLIRPGSLRPKPLHVIAAILLPWLVALPVLRVLPAGGEGLGGTWDWSILGHTMVDRSLTVGRFLAAATLYLILFCVPVLVAAHASAESRFPRSPTMVS